MVIQVDSREHAKAIEKILGEFRRQNVNFLISKLPFGDYMSLDNPRLYIDRKQNLNEICGNVVQDHARLVREIERANQCGCKLIFLIEHSSRIKCLEDVIGWVNPRLKVSPLAVSGERLYKILKSMEQKYGIRFEFCDKNHTGKRIIELLGGEQNSTVT